MSAYLWHSSGFCENFHSSICTRLYFIHLISWERTCVFELLNCPSSLNRVILDLEFDDARIALLVLLVDIA